MCCLPRQVLRSTNAQSFLQWPWYRCASKCARINQIFTVQETNGYHACTQPWIKRTVCSLPGGAPKQWSSHDGMLFLEVLLAALQKATNPPRTTFHHGSLIALMHFLEMSLPPGWHQDISVKQDGTSPFRPLFSWNSIIKVLFIHGCVHACYPSVSFIYLIYPYTFQSSKKTLIRATAEAIL